MLAFLLGLLSGYSLFFSVTKAIKQKFFKILIINQLAQNKLDNIANINLKEIQDGDPIYWVSRTKKYGKIKADITNQAKTKVKLITKNS